MDYTKNIMHDFNWQNIQATILFIKNIVLNNNLINEAHLFDEFTIIKECIQQNKEIQSFPNFKIIVEFLMCIPCSNAKVERIFSHMNNFWTDEKSKMKIKTVKAMLIVKTFFEETCSDFHNFLLENQPLLKEIHSSNKYGSDSDTPSTSTNN